MGAGHGFYLGWVCAGGGDYGGLDALEAVDDGEEEVGVEGVALRGGGLFDLFGCVVGFLYGQPVFG